MKNWIVALAVAAGYLLVSALTGRWELTWVIWAVYAVYRLAEGRISKQAQGERTL